MSNDNTPEPRREGFVQRLKNRLSRSRDKGLRKDLQSVIETHEAQNPGGELGVETKSMDWKKANAEVGQFKRGHVDILKWEESQLKDKPSDKTATQPQAAPAKPAASPAQAVPTPHKH